MEINCTTPPQLSFSDNLARVKRHAERIRVLSRHTHRPMVGAANYQLLHPGSQFCLTATNSSS